MCLTMPGLAHRCRTHHQAGVRLDIIQREGGGGVKGNVYQRVIQLFFTSFYHYFLYFAIIFFLFNWEIVFPVLPLLDPPVLGYSDAQTKNKTGLD